MNKEQPQVCRRADKHSGKTHSSLKKKKYNSMGNVASKIKENMHPVYPGHPSLPESSHKDTKEDLNLLKSK